MPEALSFPEHDPTPIFELFRGNYTTELLTAAVAHFDVFGKLASRPTLSELRQSIGLEERPANVLVTALRAAGLIAADAAGRLAPTPLAAEHLLPGARLDVSGYILLAAESPGVLAMVERLRTNRPAGHRPDDRRAAFIYREGLESAMEEEAAARHLSLALAGRAKNVAPWLAERVPLDDARLLVDVGGGTGIYSIALVLRHPKLRAIVWDRPEVLKVAREMAEQYGVADRVETLAGDMFSDPLPSGVDVCLLSNILHDWDVPECRKLVGRCAAALPAGGKLIVHDVLLNDALDGPLPVALYSAALFSATEGRAYSAAEFSGWFHDAGLDPQPPVPTLVHCAAIVATKQKVGAS